LEYDGIAKAVSKATMATTTNTSIKVKPLVVRDDVS
jgi:hypothetical protein